METPRPEPTDRIPVSGQPDIEYFAPGAGPQGTSVSPEPGLDPAARELAEMLYDLRQRGRRHLLEQVHDAAQRLLTSHEEASDAPHQAPPASRPAAPPRSHHRPDGMDMLTRALNGLGKGPADKPLLDPRDFSGR